MGAGASVPDDLPGGPMDAAAARAYFGDSFDAARFEAMAGGAAGSITPEQVRGLFLPPSSTSTSTSTSTTPLLLPNGAPMRSSSSSSGNASENFLAHSHRRRRRGAAELMKQWELPLDELEFDRTKPLFQGGQADIYRGACERGY
jgi:hypothetical protein